MRGLSLLDAAIDSLNKGLEYDPNNSAAKSDLSTLINAKTKILQLKDMVDKKNFKQGLVLADSLLKDIGQNYRDANLLKANCLINLKRVEEALNLTNVLMRVSSTGDLELLEIRARCLFVLGDIENSIKHLQQALRSDPDNSSIRKQLKLYKEIEETKETGNSAFKTGQYAEAIESWDACMAIASDCPKLLAKLYCNRASACSKLKRNDEAVKNCTKSLYFDPNFWKAHLRRAENYMILGGKENIKRAIEDFEKTAEMNPENEEDMRKKIQQVLLIIFVLIFRVNFY